MCTDGRNHPTSPCTNVCVINRACDLCEGCLRTLDEIGAWDSMSAEEKHAVLQLADERRSALARANAARA